MSPSYNRRVQDNVQLRRKPQPLPAPFHKDKTPPSLHFSPQIQALKTKKMKSVALPLAITVLLPLCFSSVSAILFPNISSIPPSLINNITHGAWDAFKNLTGCRPGEKADGLSKLKKYFHHFGYIPNLPPNITDNFDDELEAALKTYQKNFNLNVTGQLDDQTLAQLVRPRCGVADIVNGTTTMGSGKSSASLRSTRHFHTTAHYSFFPGQPTWPDTRRDLTYAFLPDNELNNEVKSLFSGAFDRWAAVTPLTFTQIDTFSSADIRIAFYSGDHGDGEPFDGVLGTLAHAFSPPSGRFHLDADEEWVVSGDISTSSLNSAVDLESVAVHEIGHLLGLGHSSVEESIMYPTISSRTKKVDLAQDDIQGIQVLYGSNPNYNGSTATASQERDSSEAHHVRSGSGLGFLLAAGFIVFLIL